jgi:hypothetical protein
MNWFLAKMVFQIVCGNGDHQPQFDEQLRLIVARDAKDAFAKAKQLGECEQESVTNKNNELIKWKFINVAEMYSINEKIHGAELYYKILEPHDANEYVQMIHQQAENIEAGTFTFQSV